MNTTKLGRTAKPSIYFITLLLGATLLSACALAPEYQPSTAASEPDNQVPSEASPGISEATVESEEPKSNATPPAIESSPESLPEPEVSLSFFGLPKPDVDYGVIDLCEEISKKLGSVSTQDCLNQHMYSNGGFSVLGRPIALREYPELPTREALGRVLLIGGIHGDEYSSVSIMFKWMEILNEFHTGVFHWNFVPVTNPDGLLREDSRRQNENGVDLNRNFPSADWNDSAESFWLDNTDSNERRYPGEQGGSEPEVAWLVDHIKNFQPDVIISVHAPYHLVDYDGPPEAPDQLGNLQLNRLGVYPGSLGNYAGVDLDKPIVTIELPYAGIMPSESQISEMWTDLVAWLIQERTKDR